MSAPASSSPLKLSWPNTLFLVGTHLAAIVGVTLYAIFHGFTWPAVLLALAFALCCGLAVTGGYHRLFAHATYEAHPILKIFYLVFGAAAFENSALKWASDHRRHHARVDQAEDPYNIRRGFWWAHILWIFFKDPPGQKLSPVGDLERDRLVRFQDRFYVPLGIAVGFLAPLGIGFLLGDPWGGLVLAGFLRLVVQHHATFCVNSLAHYWGRQPYSKSDSSRDSALTALVSFGEGYHNYHHTFPADYRNGVRRWQFDPTKWFVWTLSWTGMTRNLVRIPEPVILKARLRMQALGAEAGLRTQPGLQAALKQLEGLLDQWNALKARWHEERSRLKERSEELLKKLARELVEIRRRYRETYAAWVKMLRSLEAMPAAA